jgi:hypothetical protein
MSSKLWKLIGLVFVLALDPPLGSGRATEEAFREIRSLSLDSRDVEERYSLSSISAPVLGMVLDHAREGLRPIWGIPGASSLGEVLDLGSALSRAWISPKQDYGLVEVKTGGELMLVGLNHRQVSLRPVQGAPPGVDAIALSPTGASAILYYRAIRSLRLITGLPRESRVTAEIDISNVPQPLDSIAISDDGGAALLGVSGQNSGAVYVATERGEVWNISSIGQASAISFLKGNRDALLADRQANEVLMILDVTGTAEKITVARESQGIRQPVAVQISDDNRRVFIACSGSAAISVLDLETSTVTQLSCGCIPSGFYRLGSSSAFRLTELSERPLLLLDGGAEELRVVFVPRAESGKD